MAELFDAIARFNTILIDYCRDIWSYISIGYFKQRTVAGEVGSSTMPHKVNPIDFENAEGNLGIANAVFDHLALKLPVSLAARSHRFDGAAQHGGGLCVLDHRFPIRTAWDRQARSRCQPTAADLDANWEVLAEPIQTVMRRYGIEQPYEKLKALTRGQRVDQAGLQAFIDGLDLPDDVKTTLKAMTPALCGDAAEQARRI